MTAIGPAASILRGRRDSEVLDLGRCIVVPGLVDAHAHPFFSGDRERDFAARVAGLPAPLGMAYTVERTREALLDPDRFYTDVLEPRLQTILRHGTTTLEVKTGYALHKPGEAALLDLIPPPSRRRRRPASGFHRAGSARATARVRARGTRRVHRLFDRSSAAGCGRTWRQICRCVLRTGIFFAGANAAVSRSGAREWIAVARALRRNGLRRCGRDGGRVRRRRRRSLQLHHPKRCGRDRRSRNRNGCLPGDDRVFEPPKEGTGSSPARGGRDGGAGQRLQSGHVAVFQFTNRCVFRAQALWLECGRSALRRDARCGRIVTRRRRRDSPGRRSRFRRVTHRIARRVRLAVRGEILRRR